MSIRHRFIVILTLLIALIATIMPLPLSLDAFRPDWVLVVLIYWCLALPSRVNVISAGFVGLLLDVLLGSILGVHTAAMAVAIYIIAGNFQKIRNFSVWQQSLIVGVLSALYHLIVFWMQHQLLTALFNIFRFT